MQCVPAMLVGLAYDVLLQYLPMDCLHSGLHSALHVSGTQQICLNQAELFPKDQQALIGRAGKRKGLCA
jgi:hypothetical protein